MVLQLDGHEVLAVNTGAQALDKVRAFAPEFVLLDIGLPGVDGYEVAQRLRVRRPGCARPRGCRAKSLAGDVGRSEALMRSYGTNLMPFLYSLSLHADTITHGYKIHLGAAGGAAATLA